MNKQFVPYTAGSTKLKGYLCHNIDIKGKRPGIIVAHAWRGLDDFAILKTEQLAELGYIAFAADIYGTDRIAENGEEASKMMMPFFVDRSKLQKRIVAAYNKLSQNPLVDSNRIGAIGFCFGGLTVIELLRSGAGVKGVVSFHGLLGDKMGEHIAKRAPDSKNMNGSILMLHGHEDPLVSLEDIKKIQTEFTKKKIDWQMLVFGNTMHAFSNPQALDPEAGLFYNEKAARRAWISMIDFFDDLFKFTANESQ